MTWEAAINSLPIISCASDRHEPLYWHPMNGLPVNNTLHSPAAYASAHLDAS